MPPHLIRTTQVCPVAGDWDQVADEPEVVIALVEDLQLDPRRPRIVLEADDADLPPELPLSSGARRRASTADSVSFSEKHEAHTFEVPAHQLRPTPTASRRGKTNGISPEQARLLNSRPLELTAADEEMLRRCYDPAQRAVALRNLHNVFDFEGCAQVHWFLYRLKEICKAPNLDEAERTKLVGEAERVMRTMTTSEASLRTAAYIAYSGDLVAV